MNIKLTMGLSRILDKMDIAKELTEIEEKNEEEVAKKLFVIIITKMYKVEDEIYKFISEYKKVTIEEAKNTDIFELIKELSNVEGLKDFFHIA